MAVLTKREKQTLQNLIGSGEKSFTKLYSAKDNGCDAAIFHEMCDNRGPTLTLVYNTAGEVYGGFTSASWQSITKQPVYDKNAFLCLLRKEGNTEAIKFSINLPPSALLLDQQSGPTFGSGPDLQVFTGKITPDTDGTFALNSSTVPISYANMPKSLADEVTSDAKATDVVVYGVEDGSQSLMELQWRSEPKFDKEYLRDLMEEVESYWPLKEMGVSDDALQNVNILLIGPIGAGKSSFLNSVESAFRGHVTMSASAGSRTKSVTSAYRQYPITASDNRHYLRFQLCDCRGLDDGNNMNKDIETILEGHMPDNYTFNISNPMTASTPGYRKDPEMKDQIHCVVYVLDAEKYSADFEMSFVTDDVRDQIKDIQEMVDQKGIPQLILLNKVDIACPSTKQDISNVYRSETILQKCMDAGNCLGLPPMAVLPMKNYYMEPSNVDEISILALYNIRQMLRAADTFLRVNHLDELRSDKYESQYS
ncbi:interferon-induced protein 44-like isoform X2 [Mizuhopecten yessoensis]|uniref:Interferon-induced protein 44-like n=2 Tax=Mizuhopecten yessoensis TaxID=6573 RepID=A0A210PP13_MIZYE|nr:interferon-induced protein 44-like isoform X2 [Mizuhopecten yessoensis]XP_021378720.1 interferon-induced protein 44-like isoform X2 [Mizuhopecten yessoensis]OWF38231.1 Interferon-induced protein 44-like [Mizuhopecten yessoensis]